MKQPARDKACNRGGGEPPATTRILTHPLVSQGRVRDHEALCTGAGAGWGNFGGAQLIPALENLSRRPGHVNQQVKHLIVGTLDATLTDDGGAVPCFDEADRVQHNCSAAVVLLYVSLEFPTVHGDIFSPVLNCAANVLQRALCSAASSCRAHHLQYG